MIRKVDRIILRVPGLASAIGYYRDVLGLKLVRQDARVANFQLADGATELVLHTDPDLPGEAIYYLVDDVRDLYRRRADLKLTFTSPPAQVSRGFRATVKDPFGTVLLLLDKTTVSAGGSQIEDARTGGSLFAGVEPRLSPKRDELSKIYQSIGRTADDLPYTPHFESLFNAYAATYGEPKPTRAEVWRHLLNLRKGGKLPKLGDARSIPPAISDEDREQLRQMLGEDIGRRDRLPYTARFDELVDTFNRSQGRPISPHLVWRLVATLAK
ncbi:MAG TPA: VOC family protein [Tepidisphaeraceae bacterium]|jgi:catechol 2,3-dioxygenase-like lactoylglutathione lyase family enzyme